MRWSRSKLNFQKTETRIRRGPELWSLISLIQTGILLIDFLIRTHSKECCIDQHGCYLELSHRHRIWRIGLVICRMFSFWGTTLHLWIISISYHSSTWTPDIIVASSQWSVSWITRSTVRSCLECLSRLTSSYSWRQLKLSARKMFHTLMIAVGGSYSILYGDRACRKRYAKLTVPMLSCICCRERLYLERFVLYIYWTRHN